MPTELPGVVVIQPDVFRDTRGFFLESYHADKYKAAGISEAFVQDNHSRSVRSTLRGLHLQLGRMQSKLVRAIEGEIYDVAVDVRLGSPTFGKWVGVTLSAENFKQCFVPAGFAHGFVVLSDSSDFVYRCTDFYAPADERTIRWDDPDLAIDWQLPAGARPLLSLRDAAAGSFRGAELYA